MDQCFLSWLGLEITRRTCVTKSNCTPPSQDEHCGKSFLFNKVSSLGTYLMCSFRMETGPRRLNFGLAGLADCVRIPEKSPSPRNSSTAVRSMLARSKICGRCNPAPQERNMFEPAVVNPPSFTIARPQAGEYAPHYDRYLSLVPREDILSTLDQQRRETMLLLAGRDEEDGNFRYAPEKWSAKEVLGHVCDTERIFAYRALRISRADATPVEGFEQDDYVRKGPFGHRSLADLIEDYIAVRRATLSLLRN